MHTYNTVQTQKQPNKYYIVNISTVPHQQRMQFYVIIDVTKTTQHS